MIENNNIENSTINEIDPILKDCRHMDAVEVSSRVSRLSSRDKKVVKAFLEYAFRDSKEVYTNGTLMVPVYRVLDALDNDGNGYADG